MVGVTISREVEKQIRTQVAKETLRFGWIMLGIGIMAGASGVGMDMHFSRHIRNPNQAELTFTLRSNINDAKIKLETAEKATLKGDYESARALTEQTAVILSNGTDYNQATNQNLIGFSFFSIPIVLWAVMNGAVALISGREFLRDDINWAERAGYTVE